MSFEENEDKNGVRVTWNNIPKSKLQHHRNIAPLAALYTPLNNKSPVNCFDESHMQRCRQCKAFLNPYVTLNQQTEDIWYCQFCKFGNRLSSIPGEFPQALNPDNSTVEYTTGRHAKLPPIFFYVVDTCFEGEDVTDAFTALQESLSLSLSLLPSDSLVGFLSFGKHVSLHDISEPGSSFVFNGSKEYTLEDVQKILGISSSVVSNQGVISSLGQKFLQKIDIAEYNLATIIENLTNNTFPHLSRKERAARATGCALNVSALALQAILGKQNSAGGHIMCFIGGAATYGPGKIVSLPLKEPMRSHRDIEKAKATLPNMTNGVAKVDTLLYKQAKALYDKISTIFISIGIGCNVFAGSYDQVGLYEMDRICANTGGLVVMCDSFTTSMFKQSVIKFFQKQNDDPDEYLEMAFNATLECHITSDLQIQGVVGNAAGLPPRKDKFVEASLSPQCIGQGNTNAWKLSSVNTQSTYCIFLEKLDSAQVGHAFIQFSFHYQHPSGELRLRVTTIPLAVIADLDALNLESGFDQEAALVAIARNAIDKLQSDGFSAKTSSYDESDLTKHLDKLLVEYCGRFSQYRKGDLALFRLSNSFAMLPQFMYHLRRSQFIRVFNNSPDETSFVRHTLMHEDVTNSLIMIQPSLLSYDVETYGAPDENGNPLMEPEAVLLDSMSLGSTKILLLDTFFQILIYHGSTVAQWRAANYHNMEGYEHVKQFLEAPKKEAVEVLVDRFPLPRFIDCDEGGSQARFLMAKLNPSTSYATNPNRVFGQAGGQSDLMTDDTSLQMFMDRIQKLIVGRK
ncbi:vWA-like protein [Metschnikowia bicuspidata var. bicuspidata NRRL YB-4993]|uniref:Protein transport protein SEC23 n=1 Tax=Metschnikowia bicuspidata var. bicuspidata NRRL YB-4993 TaxID=869754 RepID=A0A1A0HJ34_9ASCO|nr:vWA-like protein [Metschnikowia bicuspidata var. bicuspidata NRRL YB-4993]OBA23897.1 vWA-like protein [Metschnikowia bicuspidata var. bicuspidata NRRL YB-4993]